MWRQYFAFSVITLYSRSYLTTKSKPLQHLLKSNFVCVFREMETIFFALHNINEEKHDVSKRVYFLSLYIYIYIYIYLYIYILHPAVSHFSWIKFVFQSPGFSRSRLFKVWIQEQFQVLKVGKHATIFSNCK